MGGSSAAPVSLSNNNQGYNNGYNFAPYSAPQSNVYQPSYSNSFNPFGNTQLGGLISSIFGLSNNNNGQYSSPQQYGSFMPYTGQQSNVYQPSYGSYAQPYTPQQSYGSPYGFQPYGNPYIRQPSYGAGNFNGQQNMGAGQQQQYQPFHMAYNNNFNTQNPSQITTPYAPQGTFGGPSSYGMGPGTAGFGFGNGATRVPDTDSQTAGQFNPDVMQTNSQPTNGQQNWMHSQDGFSGWGHDDWDQWHQNQSSSSPTLATPTAGLGAISASNNNPPNQISTTGTI